MSFESKAFGFVYTCVLTISYWFPSVFWPSHSEDSHDENDSSRWRSIRVMYFTMFLSSVGETVSVSSIKYFCHATLSASVFFFLDLSNIRSLSILFFL